MTHGNESPITKQMNIDHKKEHELLDTTEIFIRATKAYNQTIHSSTELRPVEVLFNKIDHSRVRLKLAITQEKMLDIHNRKRKTKDLKPGDIVYEKIVGARWGKLKPKCKQKKVKKDLGNTVELRNGKIVHKDNLKF